MDDPILRRIAMILPLLGASSDAEVLNAARALTRLLRGHGHTYADLVARLTAPPLPPSFAFPPPASIPPPEPPPSRSIGGPTAYTDTRPRRQKSAWALDRDDIESVYIRRGELDAWSEEFLESIHDQVQGGRTLTEKQRAKLNEILDKLGA